MIDKGVLLESQRAAVAYADRCFLLAILLLPPVWCLVAVVRCYKLYFCHKLVAYRVYRGVFCVTWLFSEKAHFVKVRFL